MLQEDIRKNVYALPAAFVIWTVLFFVYELIRLKIKYDLAEARWHNRKLRKPRKPNRR